MVKIMFTLSHAIPIACVCLLLVTEVSSQALQNNGGQAADGVQMAQARLFPAIASPAPPPDCSSEFRTFDGTCTNAANPFFGSVDRPQLLPDGVSSTVIARDDLPSAREISNAVLAQSQDMFSRRRLNELVTFFGQVSCQANLPQALFKIILFLILLILLFGSSLSITISLPLA